jgi:hypothetical protein
MVKVTLCLVLQNWVTSYSLSYSNDTNIWFYYKDPNLLEAKVLQASSSYVRSALSLYLSYPHSVPLILLPLLSFHICYLSFSLFSILQSLTPLWTFILIFFVFFWF